MSEWGQITVRVAVVNVLIWFLTWKIERRKALQRKLATLCKGNPLN